jgi:hypothetical protein
MELRNGYFQQDSATARTALTINYLEEFFPSRSPDLTPLDFFLFSHLQNVVFRSPINNLQELQQAIEDTITNVAPEIPTTVFNNLV